MEFGLSVVDNLECKQKYNVFGIDIHDTQLCAKQKGRDGCKVLRTIL